MAIGPTGELDCTMQPLAQFRWFAHRPQDHNPTLQQAWAPIYGGAVEWRDVPLVYGTDSTAASGVNACDHRLPLWAGDTANGPNFWCKHCGAISLRPGEWTAAGSLASSIDGVPVSSPSVPDQS